MIPGLPRSAYMTKEDVEREILSKVGSTIELLNNLARATKKLLETGKEILIQDFNSAERLSVQAKELADTLTNLCSLENDVAKVMEFCTPAYRRLVQKILTTEMGLLCSHEKITEFSKAPILKLKGQTPTRQDLLDLGLLPAKGFPKYTTSLK